MLLVRVPFFTSLTHVPEGILGSNGPRQCVLKHFEKPKFKILSFLAFQVSSGMYPVHL